MPETSCRSCGASVPDGARFCPSCGTAVADTSETAVIPPPPNETGRVPVARATTEAHFFGVTPPTALATLGGASVVVGIVLLVLGSTLVGLLLVVVGVMLLLFFVETARRRRESRIARAAVGAVDSVRGRAGYYATAVTAVSGARRELARRRHELAMLADERRRLLLELGEAAYAEDAERSELARHTIGEIDGSIEAKEHEMAVIAAQARERVQRAQLQVQPTEVAGVAEIPQPAPPMPAPVPEPGPVVVPEPYPGPGEADRPESPHVPEPYPPPDEGTPPAPAR